MRQLRGAQNSAPLFWIRISLTPLPAAATIIVDLKGQEC